MPSQEDYLDSLLKGLNAPQVDEADLEAEDIVDTKVDIDSNLDMNNTTTDSVEEFMDFTGVEIKEFEEAGTQDRSISVEDTTEMTEEDIERLLSETQEVAEESLIDVGENIPEDLMDMLSQEDDNDLQEIHDLLQKSDNNEAVDEGIMALLQDTPDEEVDLLESILNEENVTEELLFDEKTQKAAERKQERDEKRAEKIALREAKKAAKLEAKAAKEAEKKAKKEALEEAKKLKQQAQEVEMQEAETSMANNPEFESMEKTQVLEQDDLADLDELLNMAASSDAEDNSTLGNDFFAAFSPDEITQTEIPHEEPRHDAVNTDAMVEKVIGDKQRPKKKKLISKLLDLLTEEDAEEAEKNNENIQLSDENQNIIDELDKGKKKKAKKNKKGQEGESTVEGDEEGGANDDKKGKKPKKEKKTKKEKIPKELVAEESTSGSGKLSFKRILPIALVCISLVAIIILVANLTGDYSAKQAGREAYYKGDYQTCYQNLYGKELNESEQVMYSKSESILRIRLWIREYEMFVEEGADAEALDSLIQSVDDYPALYEYASQWTAESEVAELYAQILSILSDKYQLTEAQALEIAAVEDDVEYSAMIYAIVDGEGFGSWNQQEENEPEILEDVLPEEEELGEIPFVDNNDN